MVEIIGLTWEERDPPPCAGERCGRGLRPAKAELKASPRHLRELQQGEGAVGGNRHDVTTFLHMMLEAALLLSCGIQSRSRARLGAKYQNLR